MQETRIVPFLYLLGVLYTIYNRVLVSCSQKFITGSIIQRFQNLIIMQNGEADVQFFLSMCTTIWGFLFEAYWRAIIVRNYKRYFFFNLFCLRF